MKPSDPHKRSKALRQFKTSRKPVGIFTISVAFCDASFMVLAFFLVISPFVLQPGINMSLPESPFSGGARFGSMVLSITRGDRFYFNDERLGDDRLPSVLKEAAKESPGMPLIIEADERVSHGTVVEAWNAALAAGIGEVSIATRIAAVSEDIP
jgi:biopolymer transport protein ExbD